MLRTKHVLAISKSPKQAQTVQQLKYETILIYMTNGLGLISGLMANVADLSNSLENFAGSLPYKGFFNGGGGTTTS